MSVILEVSPENPEGSFVRIHSWTELDSRLPRGFAHDPRKWPATDPAYDAARAGHREILPLVGKRLRVTIEVVDD